MAYIDALQCVQSAETQDEAAGADLVAILFPNGGRLEEVGLLTTEASTGTAPVLSFDRITAGGTRTELGTVTPSTTAAVGVRTIAGSTAVPTDRRQVELLPGERLVLEHKTAGTAAGAYIAYALVTHHGERANSTTASPATIATA